MKHFSISRKLAAGVAAGALAFSFLAGGAARAAVFHYSYTSNDGTQTAVGTLHATEVSPGQFDATSGTIRAFGTLESGKGLIISNPGVTTAELSPSGYFIYDDQLLPGQNPHITNPGLLFDIGGKEVNIFSNGPDPGTTQLYVNNGKNDFGSFLMAQVPEPSMWAMMMIGFFGIGAMLRSRRKISAGSAAA